MESEAPADSDLSDSQQGLLPLLGEPHQSAVAEWDDDSEGCARRLNIPSNSSPLNLKPSDP